MSLRLSDRRDKFPTIVSVYASPDDQPGQAFTLANLPVAADENASVKNRWSQLRDTAQSTAPDVLGRALRQGQEWFDDAISVLSAEPNLLHKIYLNRPTNDNKTAFYRSRRLVQQRLREMHDAWTARKAEEI
nr:unnamed protein product [Spirometra erinaceieuropaei]